MDYFDTVNLGAGSWVFECIKQSLAHQPRQPTIYKEQAFNIIYAMTKMTSQAKLMQFKDRFNEKTIAEWEKVIKEIETAGDIV